MYQWQETSTTSKDENGNEYTDYTYKPVWSSNLIKSDNFFEKTHSNLNFDLQSESFQADRVKIGEFVLGKEFTDKIDWELNGFNKKWKYINRFDFADVSSENESKIGDYRVKWAFYGAEGDVISVIGRLDSQSKFQTYDLENYGQFSLLSRGERNSYSMIKEAIDSVNDMYSIIKYGLIILTMIGFVLAAEPIKSLLSWIPLLGGFLESGVVIIAIILSLLWSTVVICVSCILVNPMWIIGGVL